MAKDWDEFARRRRQIAWFGCAVQLVTFLIGVSFTVAVIWVALHFIIKWW